MVLKETAAIRKLFFDYDDLHMIQNEVGQNGDGLTFGWGMFIINAIDAVAIHHELQCFVKPSVAGILCRSTAVNQLMTGHVVIIAWRVIGHRLVQAHHEQSLLNAINRFSIDRICKERKRNG